MVRHEILRQAPVSLTPGFDDQAYRDGFVMGRDPDANERFELQRDNPTY